LPSREFALVREVLNTPETVKACVVIIRQLRPTPESLASGETRDKPFLELVALLDLEKGVNGYAGTAHGGFFTVVLDEVMGSAVNVLSGELLWLCCVLAQDRSIEDLAGDGLGIQRGRLKAKSRSQGVYGVLECAVQEAIAHPAGGDRAWTGRENRWSETVC
jgi:hypothetical protein